MKLHNYYSLLTSFIFVFISHYAFCNVIETSNLCEYKCSTAEKNDANISITGKSLKIRLYLEGSLMNSSNAFSIDGRKLMRDDLRVSPFDSKNYIPTNDPYQTTIKFVNLSVKHKHVGAGSLPQYTTIVDSSAVFGVVGDNAIVDWVFVEIRSANDNQEVIATRSGLLQRDGDVVDVDGFSDLLFSDLTDPQFYVAVYHRNHLGCMSMLVTGDNLVDFTNPQTPVFDFGTSMGQMLNFTGLSRNLYVFSGKAALWGGNFNADKTIKFSPPADDHNIMMMEASGFAEQGVFSKGAVGYFQGDFDMNSRVKYDNPFDDKNMLFGQILFYSLNTKFLGNFTYFIEQVPPRNP